MKVWRCVWAVFAIGMVSGGVAAQPDGGMGGEGGRGGGGILLADTSFEPLMTVRWMTSDGKRSISGRLAYGPPSGGVILEGAEGGNLRAYMALGGSRVDTGAGHPRGLVIRAGLTKVENARPLFDDIEAGSSVEIELSGVVLQEAIKYHQGTGIMHLKYSIGDLLACSLPGTARNQYLLSDPHDTLGGRVVAGVNATPGAFDGEEGHGEMVVVVDEEDPTRMRFVVRVPYGLFRHLLDPWDSVLPGTFFEPIHLHAEAELIPVGVEPLDREWIVEKNEVAEDLEGDGDD